ncbi:hypothetical protein JCGZ_13816 [Jatropha curcas]|uniref:Uncharacterized protein n=1 Tax=Jatropha curcas TaxID=180498 RepID=A0A067KK99_JATCU|nr:hypothetical protein JCGZ_13816 [Jatropha curcas]
MPFKQKAKKNKEGSSSSAPARRDLASRYKAPFPIYTMEEGERFTRLAKCSFTEYWHFRESGKRVDVAGMVLDTIYNASRHQGKVTSGVGSMAPILAYAARMPIPPNQPQPTDIFQHMDGAFLKKTGLVEEVKTGTIVLYRWKPWERRVGTAIAMKELLMHKRNDSRKAKHQSHHLLTQKKKKMKSLDGSKCWVKWKHYSNRRKLCKSPYLTWDKNCIQSRKTTNVWNESG